jgi:hypothetical protein
MAQMPLHFCNGSGIIVVGGEARVDAVDVDPLEDGPYRDKYGEYAASLGMTKESLASYNTRLTITIDKVWMTPTGG